MASKAKVKALRYLINSGLELNGRQLCRAIGIHHRTGNLLLKGLASSGILLMNHAGKAILYKVNNNNLIVKDILLPVFKAEKDILSKAVKSIIRNSRIPVVSAIVFGSVAGGKERPTSDLDILLLVSSGRQREILEKKLEEHEYDFILKYGNMLSSMVLSLDEFYRRLKKGDSLTRNIIQKGKSVYGKSIQEVIIQCRPRK